MEHLSVQVALARARTNVDAARNTRGSKSAITKHYRSVRKALDKVNASETDIPALKEMRTVLEDLAVVLDNNGLQDKAIKCRERAEALRQRLEERMLISQPIVQAVTSHRGSVASSSDTSSTLVTTSAATAISMTSVLQQSSLSSSKTVISVSAANVVPASPIFFSKDVNPEPYICMLPDTNEPLQTTRQLSYCLSLLQPSVQEDDVSPDYLDWRRRILNNPTEKDRLEDLSLQIIQAFAKDIMKGPAVVAEVVQLAPVLNDECSRFLLKTFIDTVDDSDILHLHSLEGLSRAIQGAAPGSINSDDLVAILRSLHKRLRSVHSANHRYHLLLATSRVLDAMVDAHVEDVDRVNLHGPLSDFLRESESSENPYLTFQAAYATQALLNVSDDDDIWHAGFRRLWLTLKGGAGFAKMPDLTEIRDALEGLERLYDVGKEGARTLKDILESIKNHESPTFTAKEGLKFKRAWYRALRTAESYIQTGKLVQFKDLVTTAPCRHQFMFQWGICLLLGQFSADSQWALEARLETIAFLGALYRADGVWNLQKETGQVISDTLAILTASSGRHFEAASSLLKEMKKQDITLKSNTKTQSRAWKNIRSVDPTIHTTANATLLKTVQDRDRRHAKLENLPNPARQPSLDDIRSALKGYHAPDLFIFRVSGQELDLETCFVNLALVEAPEHRQMEKEDLKAQAAVFHRTQSFETVRNTNTQSLIPLEQLFDKRKLLDGREMTPKRILVQGRAGIGKTTLCKKLVHAHQNGLWRDQFDTVLWIQLRQLRGFKIHTLEGLFREKVFIARDYDQEQAALAHALVTAAQQGKVLFILDGLDEIVGGTGGDDSRTFRSFLKILLWQQHVVITSRPSGLDSKILPPIDLEIETVGFSQQNVNDYLVRVLDPEAARTVQDFIRQTPVIQGLVNIPVQLDVICFSWDSLPKQHTAITMTGLYQLMVRKLWCKDAVRLKKTAGGHDLKVDEVVKLKPKKIDRLMASELQHLGYLAFKGMNTNHQIEFEEDALLSAFEDLEDEAEDNQQLSPPQLVKAMKQTSFLHTADADLEHKNGSSQQAWHFLHLTFQEYFAATWIVRHFQLQQSCPSTGMMTIEEMTAFVHQYKYNPQYEIVWSMVAGLLEGEPLCYFFGLLQGAPRDLIGFRHQQILASCLNEARTRLDSAVLVALDLELVKWLRFEMQVRQHGTSSRSMLGSQPSFPEALLVETLDSVRSWKATLMCTLGARSTLTSSSVQYLATSLNDDDEIVRSSAAEALGKQFMLSESVIQSLVAALKDDNESVRYSAAESLGSQSMLSESAIQSLVAALKDDNENFRSPASSTSGNQSMLSKSVFQSFVELTDDYKSVKYSAAKALRNQSTLSESAIQSLVAALKDDNTMVRYSAASALGNQSMLSESVIQSLVAVVKDVDIVGYSAAAETLRNQSMLSESVIQSLVAALKDSGLMAGCLIASTLGKQSTLSELVIQSLVAALKDDDESARSSAASALGNQSSLSESAIKSLVAALKNDNKSVRSSAASALGKQHTLSESVIQSLVDLLKDDNKSIRYSAAWTLGYWSTLSVSVIQSLVTALKDNDAMVRYSVAEALREQSMLSESAIQSLAAALKDNNKSVRSSAAWSLGKQSTLSESTIQSLVDALKDNDAMVRYSVAEALGEQSMLSESAVQSLAAALKDNNKSVSYIAAEALVKQSTLSESVIQSMVAALKHDNKSVRSSAAWSLGKQSTLSESTIQSLVDALKDNDAMVRYSVAEALGEQSMLSESAIQSLVAALKDEDDDTMVRSSAASALGNQSMLSELAIQSLVAALKNSDKQVKSSVSAALGKQYRSLCNSLSHLTDGEIACLYESHLFPYSCNRVMSLQVRDNRLCVHTEQGVICSELIGSDKEEALLLAFKAAQFKAGLKSFASVDAVH